MSECDRLCAILCTSPGCIFLILPLSLFFSVLFLLYIHTQSGPLFIATLKWCSAARRQAVFSFIFIFILLSLSMSQLVFSLVAFNMETNLTEKSFKVCFYYLSPILHCVQGSNGKTNSTKTETCQEAHDRQLLNCLSWSCSTTSSAHTHSVPYQCQQFVVR